MIDPEYLRSESYYDSADVGEAGFTTGWNAQTLGTTSLRLFGNSNTGNIELSNLQIPGQLPSAWTFIVQRWYARNNFPEAVPGWRDRVKAWASSVAVCFTVGHRPTWTRSLYELFERRPRTTEGEAIPRTAGDPFPIVIPPRQNFSVQLDQFGSEIDGLAGLLRPSRNDTYRPRVWIHIEGVIVDSDHDPEHAKNVVLAILNAGKAGMTNDERITQWLGGMIEVADPDNRAQIHAIRDGILEGRHRS